MHMYSISQGRNRIWSASVQGLGAARAPEVEAAGPVVLSPKPHPPPLCCPHFPLALPDLLSDGRDSAAVRSGRAAASCA